MGPTQPLGDRSHLLRLVAMLWTRMLSLAASFPPGKAMYAGHCEEVGWTNDGEVASKEFWDGDRSGAQLATP